MNWTAIGMIAVIVVLAWFLISFISPTLRRRHTSRATETRTTTSSTSRYPAHEKTWRGVATPLRVSEPCKTRQNAQTSRKCPNRAKPGNTRQNAEA